jgi:predicted Zn finger-like uncharacterized protein
MYIITCPECDAELKSKSAPPEGRKIRCKECSHAFVPTNVKAAAAETVVENKPAAGGGEEEDTNPYGMVREEDTADQIEAKKKVRFDGVDDKKKRSARGPAMSLLVMPSNLLIASGGITFLIGLGLAIMGLWPLVFTDVEPSDDDLMENGVWIVFGLMTCVWGVFTCLGASRMQNLESYTWAMTGSVMGILPLLAGIYGIIMLRNPRVVEGFMEVEGASDDEMEEDDEEDEDEDDDEDDEPKKKKKK